MIRKILSLLLLLFIGIATSYAQTPFIKVVAQDGSGDYATVQQAVNAAAGSSRHIILLRNGV